MTALGEPTLKPVGLQLGGATTLTPARTYCPNWGRPKPRWLPPRQFCCPQDHYLQGTYGISCDDYWQLLAIQDGRCAICLLPPKAGKRLVVDHNHDTGTIDGLTHFGCNRRLQSRWRRYLADPPGRVTGLQVAPGRLKAIRAKDAAKQAADRERREAAKTKPAGNGQLDYRDKLRAMTNQGGT